MFNLGEFQELRIVKNTDHGVYLSEIDGGEERILLPKNQVEKNHKVGNIIKVFIYKDSSDRLIATTSTPLITLDKIALLEVTEINSIGAFLNMGLAKDLLLPYKEQTTTLKPADKVLVKMYIDKSERLCATTKIYDTLRTDSPYIKNDLVNALVISYNPKFGTFVAIDGIYNGLIPSNECNKTLKIGETIRARVLEVRPDGKLNLTLREEISKQIESDSQLILSKLSENNGYLPYNDKSTPESIKKEFNLSKNSFKKAIGRLYKERKIDITTDGITLMHP